MISAPIIIITQIEMPRCQHKNTINYSQKNMPPNVPSNATTVGSENDNTAGGQDNRKTDFMNTIEVLTEETKTSLKEIYENKYSGRK